MAAKTWIHRNRCNGIDLEIGIVLKWLGMIISFQMYWIGFQMYWISSFDFYSLVFRVSWWLFIPVSSVCLLRVERVFCDSGAFAFSGLWGLLPDSSLIQKLNLIQHTAESAVCHKARERCSSLSASWLKHELISLYPQLHPQHSPCHLWKRARGYWRSCWATCRLLCQV